MKLVVRAFVLGLFAAGASAAVVSAHSSNIAMVGSHQAMVAAMPTPGCGPSGTCNGQTSSMVAAMPTPGCGPSGTCNGQNGAPPPSGLF
jgi:hypothetical protein